MKEVAGRVKEGERFYFGGSLELLATYSLPETRLKWFYGGLR